MPNWEFCRILPSSPRNNWQKYVAVAYTPEGDRVIDQTEEVNFTRDSSLPDKQSRLIGRLLADAWEPMPTYSTTSDPHFYFKCTIL